MRRAALEQNIGLDVGDTAGRIEQPANRVAGVEQQQRMGCERKRYRSCPPRPSWSDGRHAAKTSSGGNREALEPRVDALVVPDADMNLAALQQRHLIHAKSFRQFHAHVGEAFGISRQEFRQERSRSSAAVRRA